MLLTIVIGIGISVTSMQMQMHGESRELWMTVTRGSSLLLGLMRAVSLAIITRRGVFVGREPAPGVAVSEQSQVADRLLVGDTRLKPDSTSP